MSSWIWRRRIGLREPGRDHTAHRRAGLVRQGSVRQELPTQNPERMKGQSNLAGHLPNLDDHRFEDGCRTMDVGSWLQSLGLGQYEANFRDNKSMPTYWRGWPQHRRSALGDRYGLDVIAVLASAKPLSCFSKAATLESRTVGRTPHHGHVLRSCRLDEPCCEI